MLLIPNPWTEPRPDFEYSYGGEAHIERPKDPDALSDEEWAQYLFMNSNVKGIFLERWFHMNPVEKIPIEPPGNPEPITDPEVYQNFFATLERSFFIGRN